MSRYGLGLVIIFIILLGLVTPVWAIDDPDSVTIWDVFVFRSVLETGDQLYLVRYSAEYDPLPTEAPEATWQVALYDTDGATLVASRPLNSYGINVTSIYLEPAGALAWEGAYNVRVMGSPAVFPTLIEGVNMRTSTLTSSDYYEAASLAGVVQSQAEALEYQFDEPLLTNLDKLNASGENLFITAVPGLRSMAPEVFSTGVRGSDPYDPSYNTTYGEGLASHSGSRLSSAIDDIAARMGISSAWAGAWLVAMAFVVFAGAIYAGTKSPALSMIGAFPVAVGGIWLGLGSTALLTGVLLLVFVVAVIFGIYFILGRFA